MNPGVLNERVEILSLESTGKTLSYYVSKNIWAKAELLNKTNYFSKVGMGVKSAKFTIRRQEISLHNALKYRGNHYFITSITPVLKMYLEVEAAMIEPDVCIKTSEETKLDSLNRPRLQQKTEYSFPGFITEKYLRYTEEKGHGENEISFVVVTPKEVVMDTGKLVKIKENYYKVINCHLLDEYKNEYEVVKTEDN